MKNILLVGKGLAANIFFYHFCDYVKKNLIKDVKLDLAYDLFGNDNLINIPSQRVNFWIHSYIDDILTPRSSILDVKRELTSRVDYSYIYSEKIFNDERICDISKLFKDTDSIHERFYPGDLFIQNLLYKNKQNVDFLKLIDCLYNLNITKDSLNATYFEKYDAIIWADLIYDLDKILIKSGKYNYKKTNNVKAFPVGVQYLNYDADKVFDVIMVYNTNPCDLFYRETIYANNFIEREYSLCYDNNINRIYDRLIYPGKIINDDYDINMFKSWLSGEYTNMYLLGKYAQWDGDILADSVSNRSRDILNFLIRGFFK